MRISRAHAYFPQNAQEILLAGQWTPHPLQGLLGGVAGIEHQTAVGAGKPVQREDIPMLLKEPPYLDVY